MEERISEVQRTLYDQIPNQVRLKLAPAFEKAATESGRGMKARIMDILREHAQAVAETMFDDARSIILEGLNTLTRWLEQESNEMTGAVRRCAAVAEENLVPGGAPGTSLLEQRKGTLVKMLACLAELERDASPAAGSPEER